MRIDSSNSSDKNHPVLAATVARKAVWDTQLLVASGHLRGCLAFTRTLSNGGTDRRQIAFGIVYKGYFAKHVMDVGS